MPIQHKETRLGEHHAKQAGEILMKPDSKNVASAMETALRQSLDKDGWTHKDQSVWRGEASESGGSSPLIRARQSRAQGRRDIWPTIPDSQEPSRLWDDCWESTSVCSDPGSQQQQRKLKQRALQAEIQSLHRSLVSLKRGIHMAAAQRPGSNSKIPLPPGHLQHIQQSSSSGQGPGTPAASVEWEDLDLRSSSPSAASVEGLSKDGLARKPVRISSRHTQADIVVMKSGMGASPRDRAASGEDALQIGLTPQAHAISAKFEALWGDEKNPANQQQEGIGGSTTDASPSPVQGSHTGRHDVFSASLVKAMKAYKLFSDKEDDCPAAEVTEKGQRTPDDHDLKVIANATDSTAQKTGKEAEETMAYAVQDHATQEQLDDTQHDMNCSIATSAKTATPPNSHFEALPLSGPARTITSSTSYAPPPSLPPVLLPKSQKGGFGRKLGRLWKSFAADHKGMLKKGERCPEIHNHKVPTSGNQLGAQDGLRPAARQNSEVSRLQRLGSLFQLSSPRDAPPKSHRAGPAPWPLPPAASQVLHPISPPDRVPRLCQVSEETSPASLVDANMKVNIDQWLSNEKAQLSLLVPPWVPNKTPLPKASEGTPAAPAPVQEPAPSPVLPVEPRSVSMEPGIPFADQGRNTQTTSSELQRSSKSLAGNLQTPQLSRTSHPKPYHALSPFGRVLCSPERAVPFVDVTATKDLGEGRAADTPVTRLEKEMKHNAGMDGVDDAGSQWRTIASRVVHGQGVKHAQPNTTAFYPPSTPDRPEALGHVGSPGRFKRGRGAGSASFSVMQDAVSVGPPDVAQAGNRFQALPNAMAKAWPPQSPQQPSSTRENPELTSPWLNHAETFQQEIPRWTTRSADEKASFPGVLALSQRFENAQLLERNVSKLARSFRGGQDTREETARWAQQQAARLAALELENTTWSIPLKVQYQSAR